MIRNAKVLFNALILTFFLVQHCVAQDKKLYLADPTIFQDEGIFYLYGTGSNNGFKVYTSKDSKNWEDQGFALKKGDSFGEGGFWAPQVFKYKDKYFMAYTADEQIAIAEAESPLGPFVQKEKKALSAPMKLIDPFVFFEGDKIYLYHVRLLNGNKIYVAELNADLSAIKENTAKQCIAATEPWEDTENAEWKVTEGPTVLKHQKLYYLFYSANDFRNIEYAVGYAVSKSPLGPWKKSIGSPIISRKQTGWNGSGHGDFFLDEKGKLNYVFHTHNTNESSRGKRKTAIVEAYWKREGKLDVMKISEQTFRFLEIK